jgi:hypothetical protein
MKANQEKKTKMAEVHDKMKDKAGSVTSRIDANEERTDANMNIQPETEAWFYEMRAWQKEPTAFQ